MEIKTYSSLDEKKTFFQPLKERGKDYWTIDTKSELDDFIWVPGWNPAYTSWIRIYAAPTLTNQLGIAICISPERIFKKIPSPLSDVAWNCIVFAIKPQCKNKEKTQEDEVGDGTTTSTLLAAEIYRNGWIFGIDNLQKNKGRHEEKQPY